MRNFKKESLIKIIQLHDDIFEEKFIEKLIKKLLNISSNEEIFVIKINSIISDIKDNKYSKKTIFKDYTMYFYGTYIDIFIKEHADIDDLTKEIKLLADKEGFNGKELSLINLRNPSKIKNVNIENLANFLNSRSKTNYKIKINKNNG